MDSIWENATETQLIFMHNLFSVQLILERSCDARRTHWLNREPQLTGGGRVGVGWGVHLLSSGHHEPLLRRADEEKIASENSFPPVMTLRRVARTADPVARR